MRSNDGPTVTVVSLSNLAVPPADEEGEGTVQDAIMLDGPVYPIKEDFKELGYTFFRGVHGNKGINRWVHVVGSGESGAELERVAVRLLSEHGWQVNAQQQTVMTGRTVMSRMVPEENSVCPVCSVCTSCGARRDARVACALYVPDYM